MFKAERRSQALLPSVSEDEVINDLVTIQFEEHDLYVPPAELNAIAARAALRKMEKQRSAAECNEEEGVADDESHKLVVSSAELNAIAYRAAARKMEKQQIGQHRNEVAEQHEDSADVKKIALRAQERRERQDHREEPSSLSRLTHNSLTNIGLHNGDS